MKRIMGMGVGVLYLGIALGALSRANAGWDSGYTDIGFWWSVVAALLTMVALTALIGTWIHTRESQS